MSKKSFQIHPVIPKILVLSLRTILFLLLVKILLQFVDKNFETIGDKIKWVLEGITNFSAESPELKKLLKIFEFAGIVALILYTFKKFLADWFRQTIAYLLAKKLPSEQLKKEKWIFPNVTEMLDSTIRFIIKSLMPLTLLKVFSYLILTGLLGWLGYEGFNHIPDDIIDSGKGISQISHNYHIYSANDKLLSEVKEPFKLIFSFDHKDKNVQKHGTDELKTMKRFLKSFKGCLEDTIDSVKLEIRGYVSERLDKNYKSEIQLANDRARNTKKQLLALKEEIQSDYNKPGSKKVNLGFLNQIDIKVVEWQYSREEYEKLIRTRIFEESKDSTLKKDEELLREFTAEYLNRRVEVSVIQAGSCYP